MARQAGSRTEPPVGRWTPVVVGGTKAGPIEARRFNRLSTRADGELAIVPEPMTLAPARGGWTEMQARIGFAGSVFLHLVAAVLAIAYVQPDMQLAGEGTLAQTIESGLVIVPIESVKAAPSAAEALKADADTPQTTEPADTVAPSDEDRAATLDPAETEAVQPDPAEAAKSTSPSAAASTEALTAQADPQVVAPAAPDAVQAQAEPDAAPPAAAPAVDPAQPSDEDVVIAPAPSILAAPSAEDAVARAAPEEAAAPTAVQTEQPAEPDKVVAEPIPPQPEALSVEAAGPAAPAEEPIRKPALPAQPKVAKPVPPDRTKLPEKSAEKRREPLAPRPAETGRQAAVPKEGGEPGAQSSRPSAAGSSSTPKAAQGIRPGTKGSGGPGEVIAGTALLPSYTAQLRAHYARYKLYPAAARSRNQRGIVRISFTLNAGGTVTAVQLVSSSGVPALDEAALAAAKRASPFPAIPPELRRATMSVTLPVDFSIR